MKKDKLPGLPDQSGRLAIVTGSSRGLGLIVARELARLGAHVVIACRNIGGGDAAVTAIRAAVASAHVEVLELDLASLKSVRRFAKQFTNSHDKLDILVNNAGVALIPERCETEDGFEMQLGTNYLGHFALTGLLLEALTASPSARVVSIGGSVHNLGRMKFDDLQSSKHYGRWQAYGRSKLATLLFAFELDRRLTAADSSIRSVAAHPGVAGTHAMPPETPMLDRLILGVSRLIAQSPEDGAKPYVYAATASDLDGSSYIGPGGFLELRGDPGLAKPSKASQDKELARRLWTVSEDLTEVSFEFQ